jgi:hypothetical protein
MVIAQASARDAFPAFSHPKKPEQYVNTPVGTVDYGWLEGSNTTIGLANVRRALT